MLHDPPPLRESGEPAFRSSAEFNLRQGGGARKEENSGKAGKWHMGCPIPCRRELSPAVSMASQERGSGVLTAE